MASSRDLPGRVRMSASAMAVTPAVRTCPEGIGGVPVSRVSESFVTAKGSRPFEAVTDDARALFVKVFGSDHRDADLLYRAYRGIRLRGVGDTRPAASLFKAVEHEALLAVMAERAGVTVPRVGQVIRADDGSVLLTMELVAGLTGVGMQPGPAVSAVLLYRLATYWLPVLPSWLCWQSLQHRGYV